MVVCTKHIQELRFGVYLRVALDSGSIIKRWGGPPKGISYKLLIPNDVEAIKSFNNLTSS